MFKRELKVNLKSFLVWTIVTVLLYLVIFLVYPSIMSEESSQQINEFIKVFPEEMLKTFNMDLATMDTAYGWLKSEGFVFVYLIFGLYASLMGANVLLKEESDKTIEYLGALPVTRTRIVLTKIAVSVIYIIASIAVTGVFFFVAMELSGDFDKKQLLLLCVTPVFPALVLFSATLFISTFFKKTSKMLGPAIGLVFASYVLNVIGEMSDNTKPLRFVSAYALADCRNVIKNVEIRPVLAVVAVLVFVAFSAASVVRYNHKELV
ncbi:MAG: ABC transporter permease [Lachnospiraceae bacterium]|nr:ABC transporter permease [Lachnospiraceae bacterium]